VKIYIGPYASHWSGRKFQHWYLHKKYKKYYWEIDEEKYDRFDRVIDKVSDWWEDVLNLTINKYFHWRNRKIKVRIDRYDTWNMDHTLALITLPMLKQLKETKHGSPLIDDEDVPEHLRSTSAPPLTKQEKSCGVSDENLHKRWEWLLDELIWTFEQLADEDSDSQFYSGKSDILWENQENGLFEMKRGPKDTFKLDREGLDAFNKRISNGLVLFGKYYRGLWD